MKAEWQRAAAYVVAFDEQGRILLTQFVKDGHPRSGAWTLPGGGMEWGEQAHETAIREVREETGLAVEIGALLGVQSAWIAAEAAEFQQPGLALRLIFQAHSCSGKLKTAFEDDDTTADAAWFTLDEVTRLDRVEVVDFGIAKANG